MRILQILDNLAIMSGVSSVVMNIYRNIDRKQFVFDFLVASKSEYSYEKEIVKLGGNVYYSGNPLSLNRFVEANKYINDFFKNNAKKYDCVHLHSPTMSEFTIRYAKKYGIKSIIAHSHSTMTSPNLIKSFINYFLTLRINYLANYYWACSTEAAEYLFGSKVLDNNNYSLIYNAINCQNYKYISTIREEIRENLNVEKNFVVGHISNFSKIKNHMFLINVIQEVVDNDSRFRFLFVGDGETRIEFEQKLIEKGLIQYCIFIGKSNEVSKYLQICDCIVLPSIKEGLPVTIVEAQACGLPCILSDTITKDVKVGMVKYLQLDSKVWARELLSLDQISNQERINNSNEFSDSNFSIEKEVKRIEKKYSLLCYSKK